jgi:hypothetical protein
MSYYLELLRNVLSGIPLGDVSPRCCNTLIQRLANIVVTYNEKKNFQQTLLSFALYPIIAIWN